MKLKEYKITLKSPLRQAVLCFLVRPDEVLLAMKKRGFGTGRWNGVGGKPGPGESLREAAVRETKEEIGITPLALRPVATLDFYFPEVPLEKDWNQQVHVYLVDNWEGEPVESEEMKPQWFRVNDIPFDSMWSDDIHWLPKVLNGTSLKAEFMFDKNDQLLEFKVGRIPP